MAVYRTDCGTDRARRLRFRFDAAVVGNGGRIGVLRSLLLEPGTRRITGLVIQTGFLFPRELRVPLRKVMSAVVEEVRISLTPGEARELQKQQAKLLGANLASKGAASSGLSPALVALSDAMRVTALEGAAAGRLRQLLVDASSGEIVELIVESGWFTRQSRRLPAAWVRRITGAAVEVEAAPGALGSLPLFRGDRELRADILDAWFYDERLRSTFLRAPLDAKVREGIATLEGYAASGVTRGRLQEGARSVPGVLEVRCDIVADDELVHAVMSALANDSRTRPLRPLVQSNLGVILLEGDVPDKSLRDAASEAVASVPRVRGVINRLRIKGEGRPLGPIRVLHPRVGQRVYTRDGHFGQVTRVLLYAQDRLVAGLCVGGKLPVREGAESPRFPQKWPRRERCVVVPADWITAATGGVLLRVGHTEVASLPEFRADEFQPPETGWVPPYPYSRRDILLVPAGRWRQTCIAGEPANPAVSLLKTAVGAAHGEWQKAALQAEAEKRKRLGVLWVGGRRAA